MRKFGMFILALIIIGLFGGNQSFGYFEKTAYCSFENGQLTIFLKKEIGLSKCQTYLQTIDQLALQKYNEISRIREYISQGDDVRYRRDILKKKQDEFLKLVNYKSQIKSVVSQFEMLFFNQYHEALNEYMKLYYSDLETQYYILMNQNIDNKSDEYLVKIANYEQQMTTVNQIINAENLDDIMNAASNYIYFKRVLTGK